jgi:hypothetical protein
MKSTIFQNSREKWRGLREIEPKNDCTTVNFIPPRWAITLHHSEFLFLPRKVITLLISVHVRPSAKRNFEKEKNTSHICACATFNEKKP